MNKFYVFFEINEFKYGQFEKKILMEYGFYRGDLPKESLIKEGGQNMIEVKYL